MKKVYLLTLFMKNGTVTMFQSSTVFETLELAEKSKIAVDRANKHLTDVYTRIEEVNYFSNESEVPILNEKGDNNEE